MMSSGFSSSVMQPSPPCSDLDILLEGSSRLITRAPVFGIKGSGSVNVVE